MKYIIVLGDGMADRPIDKLGGKTPLEYADTPQMDRLAALSEIGMLNTIPKGMKPGSDTANLSVLGYDPKECYSGRSPLEALSIGIDMLSDDVAMRCNLVTLTEDEVPFEEQTILDHSSGEISTADAAILVEAIKPVIEEAGYRLYVGTSYRHCLIIPKGRVRDFAQPHDHLGEKIGTYLPEDESLLSIMRRSFDILKDHPLNKERRAKGLNPANCCWFWGAGTKPKLSAFSEKTGKRGVMISAVDLLKGIAIGASMKVIEVEGATGGLETNYEGKARAAVKELVEGGADFAYIHVEAPDEMGHQGSVEKKVKAIEYLDERVIRLVLEEMRAAGEDFRLAVLPDHPTPIAIRTHTPDPVPFLIYDSTDERSESHRYNEREAGEAGLYLPEGPMLIERLFSK